MLTTGKILLLTHAKKSENRDPNHFKLSLKLQLAILLIHNGTADDR